MQAVFLTLSLSAIARLMSAFTNQSRLRVLPPRAFDSSLGAGGLREHRSAAPA